MLMIINSIRPRAFINVPMPSASRFVQTDEIGEPRAERHEREPYNETRFGERAVFYHPRFGSDKHRPHDQQRESHVTNAAADVRQRVTPIMLKTGKHHGEQTPRGRIINRTRPQRHRPMLVPVSLLKWIIRASIGNAGIQIDAPVQDIAYARGYFFAHDSWWRKRIEASPRPSTNG